jgi:hypothetical protein
MLHGRRVTRDGPSGIDLSRLAERAEDPADGREGTGSLTLAGRSAGELVRQPLADLELVECGRSASHPRAHLFLLLVRVTIGKAIAVRLTGKSRWGSREHVRASALHPGQIGVAGELRITTEISLRARAPRVGELSPDRSNSSTLVAMRNSKSGAPSNLGPRCSRSSLRFRCVNGTLAILWRLGGARWIGDHRRTNTPACRHRRCSPRTPAGHCRRRSAGHCRWIPARRV